MKSIYSELHSPAPRTAAAPVSQTREEHLAVEEARRELGDEVAEAMPEVVHVMAVASEPGARAVIGAIVASLPDPVVEADGMPRISLCKLRNLSRGGREEFIEFRRRLAEVLTVAGREHSLRFTAEAEEEAQYVLVGSAYLVIADGFDQWELYLRLCPADDSWTIWQPEGPVRILRHARPGLPQITRWPPPEV